MILILLALHRSVKATSVCAYAACWLLIGTGFMGTWLNGYLVLQGNIPLRSVETKHVLKLLAGERLGTRWAKYPLARRRPERS